MLDLCILGTEERAGKLVRQYLWRNEELVESDLNIKTCSFIRCEISTILTLLRRHPLISLTWALVMLSSHSFESPWNVKADCAIWYSLRYRRRKLADKEKTLASSITPIVTICCYECSDASGVMQQSCRRSVLAVLHRNTMSLEMSNIVSENADRDY